MNKPSKEYLNKKLKYVNGELIWRYNEEASPQWNGKFANQFAGCMRQDGYTSIRIDGTLYLRHRVIWAMFYDEWPKELDHINRDQTDDRIHNLREADRYLNNQNTFATGVTKLRGRFWARLFRNGKNKSLGVYDTFQEAHSVYLEAKAQFESESTYD